ncbi:MAG: DUF4236 domain-containing protein [Frankiaceae bacterium]
MGFYVRTSLKAGPFRFSASRSGLSVSAGVPGFRVGASPRGNYVRLASGALSYRVTVPAQRRSRPAVPQHSAPRPLEPARQSDVKMQDVTGANVRDLVAASPSELVTQLQAAARVRAIWPWAAIGLLILVGALGTIGAVLLLPGIPGVIWLWFNDRARHSVVAFYQVEDRYAERFGRIVDAVTTVQQAQRVWLVEAAGAVRTTYQYKTNAGASSLIRRSRALVTMRGPKQLVTNIAVPSLTAGQRAVYFLPDRVLVRQGRDFTDVPYPSLLAYAEHQRFIEDGPTPSDSQQIDTTWRYVNVKGGPDRRYKDNRRLPVMLYGRLTLTTQAGLHLIWDASRPDVTARLADVLRDPATLALA